MSEDKQEITCLEINIEDPNDCMPEHYAFCYSWEEVEQELKYLKQRYKFNNIYQ